jgi:hypothetical protein
MNKERTIALRVYVDQRDKERIERMAGDRGLTVSSYLKDVGLEQDVMSISSVIKLRDLIMSYRRTLNRKYLEDAAIMLELVIMREK